MPAQPATSAVCPAPGACIAVHLVGDRQGETTVPVAEFIDWADAEGYTSAVDYPVRSVPGGPVEDTPERVSATRLPLRLFIAHLADRGGAFAGLTADDIGVVKIPKPRTGHVATLTGGNLRPAGSNGFAGGLEPVLYTFSGTDSVAYIRPLTDSAQDVNEPDKIQSDGNAALDLTLSTTGTVLQPTITASPSNPSAGQDVTLTASVPGAPPGTTYAWTFGGGGTGTGPATTHSWPTAGTWGVGLVVQAPDNSYGETTTVVTVGDPPPPTTTPTASPTPGGGDGPGPGTGQTPGPSGSPSPTSSPTSKPTKTPTSSPTSTPSATSTGSPTTSPTTSPTPSPTSAPTPTETGGPDASPSPTDSPGPTPRPDDGTVTGILLSSADVRPPGGEEPSAVDQSSTVVPVSHRIDVSAALAWSMILLALLALGAAGELRPHALRRLRPRRPHPKETA